MDLFESVNGLVREQGTQVRREKKEREKERREKRRGQIISIIIKTKKYLMQASVTEMQIWIEDECMYVLSNLSWILSPPTHIQADKQNKPRSC